MCGIAGIVRFDGAPISSSLLDEMSAALRHRGPDDRGVFCRQAAADRGGVSAGLVSQRLSVVDLAGGHQPIANEDGTVWTVLNGEIYNFVALRTELEDRAHRFATRSDTEVIAHAYEEWGDRFVDHLDGMFALAIWDERAARLVLARDRFGKKPLVYYDNGAQIAFASELQALMHLPGIPKDIDVSALGTYLAYMAIPAPRTIYRQIRKIPPAHMLARTRDGVCVKRYWTLAYAPKVSMSEDAAAERVADLVDAAVRKRLMGEVPLGAFLSGGVDSSSIVASMAVAMNRPVRTFSIGFDYADYDELSHARRVAAAFGCEHQELVVKPSAADIIPKLVHHFGEPFADSSAVPSWYLAQLARGSVTVALSGDGGDEVFAGYGRHLANDLAERWMRVPKPMRHSAERLAGAPVLAKAGGTRATRFAAAARLSRSERYRAWAGVFSADLVRSLSDVASAAEESVRDEFEAAEGLDSVDAFLAVDTRFYLPTDLLPKADITSMAHSLEVRSPLLDVPLAEFAATLPSRLKIRRLVTKRLLKRAMAGRVPTLNLSRPKRGFAPPVAEWLRGDLSGFMRDHLQPSRAAKAGVLRQAGLDRLIDEHVSGSGRHGHQLWTLLMLESWYRMFQPS